MTRRRKVDGAVFSAAEFASGTSGSWRGDLSAFPEAAGISTDTRSDGKNKVFFALSGENFDAHNFLNAAAASGCCALCIRRSFAGEVPPLPVLEVDDVLKAYQQMSAMHRRRFPELTLAGITGSVGKTSTKEMIRAIFTRYAGDPEAVLYTIGNTNNHIGVPQNLLRLTSKHRFAVIEMGTSSPGEILPLSMISAPTAAAVNTVAACHLEKLLSLDGVAQEKSAVFAGVPENGIVAIGRGVHGEAILRQAAGARRILTFGNDPESCDVAAHFEQGTLDSGAFTMTFFNKRSYRIEWHLAGEYQALNAACAAAVALACNIPEADIAAGLVDTELPGMRMKRTTVAGVNYINDAYNANPASMRALIMLLKSGAKPEELILCLGGMRELGGNCRAEHETLLELVHRELPGVRIITVGKEFAGIPGNGSCFPESSAAAEFLRQLARPGDTVVVKGSRGNCMELILPEDAR